MTQKRQIQESKVHIKGQYIYTEYGYLEGTGRTKHREDGPACVAIGEDGKVHYYAYFLDGKQVSWHTVFDRAVENNDVEGELELLKLYQHPRNEPV